MSGAERERRRKRGGRHELAPRCELGEGHVDTSGSGRLTRPSLCRSESCSDSSCAPESRTAPERAGRANASGAARPVAYVLFARSGVRDEHNFAQEYETLLPRSASEGGAAAVE